MRFSHIKLIYILGVWAMFSSTFALTQGRLEFSQAAVPEFDAPISAKSGFCIDS